jgi:lysophospholipase L1-like esterase
MRGITVWSHVRGWLALSGVLTVILLTAACRATPTPDAAAPVRSSAAAYSAATGPVVALGDSYTAGALLPLDAAAKPAGCLRSSKAYPALVAHALGARLVDVSCASAGVKNMTTAQQTYLGTNPPQLSALAPDDRLVLLTLGGDDLGFLNVLKECVAQSFTQPWGSPCEAHYTNGGTDQLAAAVAAEGPKISQVLEQIAGRHRRRRRLPARDRGQGERPARRRRARGRRHVREHLHADHRARLLPARVGQGRRGRAARLARAPVPPQHPRPGGHGRRGP